MKTMKPTNRLFPVLLFGGCLLAQLNQAGATPLGWTGLSSATNGWSASGNWSPAQTPVPADTVTFNVQGATNVVGAVNNTVDADYTVSKLTYSGLFTNGVATNLHTTYINDGAVLTAKAPTANFFYVGTGLDDGLHASNYTTITGTGRLVLGDPASPSTSSASTLQVKQTSVTSGNHRAVLDMSGLDNFVFAAGKFVVAGDGTFGGGGDRPQASVLLAKTNLIICAAPRTADPSAIVSQPFTIGYSQGSQSATTTTNHVILGQENTLNADYFKIGGLKLIGQMSFRPCLVHPTLKLRAADGVSRVPRFVCGDHGEARIASFVARGNLDLGAGEVDALIDQMDLGINGWRDNATDTGSASGVMTLGAGIFDVKTLNIGCQQGNNLGNATGIATVRTNATLVAQNINIGRDSGAATGKGTGTLIINAGLVNVSGSVLETDGIGGNGVSTLVITNNGRLDMMPAGDTSPGNVMVRNFNFGAGLLTNYNILGISNLTLLSPITNFVVEAGRTLAPVAQGRAGVLTVKGSLTFENGKLLMDLNDPANPAINDQVVVTDILTLSGINTMEIGGTILPGTYPVLTYGTLVGDTNNIQVTGALANSRFTFAFDASTLPFINLTVSGGPATSLIWSGNGGSIWDLHATAGWNGGAEKFYDLDAVTFDNSSPAASPITLVGTLEPAGIELNTTNSFTFSGSGKLSGAGGLTNDGTGILTLSTTNDYVGDTLLNSGTLLVNGAIGVTAVSVKSGATLGGSGTILGPVMVEAGGSLVPGTSMGTLTISNNLTLSDGSSSYFEADLSAATHDRVIGLNTVTFGGTLNMVMSGRSPHAGDAFKLFSATTTATALSSPYLGAFAGIVPPEPGPWLGWNTSTLAKDGTLRIISLAPALASQVNGNQISLSWPSQNIGWLLQAQTNSTAVGLGSNWVDVPGSTTSDNAMFTIDPANGAVFYRLVAP